MKYLTILFASVILGACSTAPTTRNQSQTTSPEKASASLSQNPSIDTVLQFLLSSAAADFHAHGPSHLLRFRNVHFGHRINPEGGKQYLLCGEFHSAQEQNSDEWVPFVTIKTSGYEQMIGSQAAGWCQSSLFNQDEIGDVSASLQRQYDAL